MLEPQKQEELIKLLYKAHSILRDEVEPDLVVLQHVRSAILWMHQDYILNHLDAVLGKKLDKE